MIHFKKNLLLIVMLVIACIPVFFTELPPLSDYPNHLAREFIIANYHQNDFFQKMYEIHFSIIPDLAIDAFMPLLINILHGNAILAGRILVCGLLIGYITGMLCLTKALSGKITIWSYGMVFVIYNLTFMRGFLNFQVSLILAMFLSSYGMKLREKSFGFYVVFSIISSTLLFFAHLMGLFFYLAMMGSNEAYLAYYQYFGKNHHVISVKNLAKSFMGMWRYLFNLILPSILYCFTILSENPAESVYYSAHDKLMQFVSSFFVYSKVLDLSIIGCLLGVLCVAGYYRLITINYRGLVAFIGFIVIYFILPHDFKTTGFLDTRLAVMVGFSCFFIIGISSQYPKIDKGIMILFLVLFSAKSANIAYNWSVWDQNVQNFKQVAKYFEPGDKIIQIDINSNEVKDFYNRAPYGWNLWTGQKTYYHIGALYVTQASGFYQYLFADKDKQPIWVKKQYFDLQNIVDNLPYYKDMIKPNDPNSIYFCHFDKVVVIDNWAIETPDKKIHNDYLTLISGNSTVALYRINKENCNLALTK